MTEGSLVRPLTSPRVPERAESNRSGTCSRSTPRGRERWPWRFDAPDLDCNHGNRRGHFRLGVSIGVLVRRTGHCQRAG